MTPIIEVKNLSKKYHIGESQPYITLRDTIAGVFSNPLKSLKDGLRQDEFWALKGINFTVEPGEVVGIIGHNGAGKSTLLKILSRITPPTTGEITLRGRVGSLLEVGTGFQQELTGRENIFLNGAILGMTQAEIKKKFEEIVDFAEVEKFIDTPVKHYSSGMYMRLAFSIAAHLDPEILIVDEVLAVGDAGFQKKCLGKMSYLASSGRTVIYVSHNMQSVVSLCSHAIYLSSGRINNSGKVSEVIKKYELEFQVNDVNSYSSFPEMNGLKVAKISSKHKNNTLSINGLLSSTELYKNASIGLSIHDESDHVMAIIYSGPKKTYRISPGDNKFSLDIKNVNLTPGSYFIKIRIEESGYEIYKINQSVSQFIVGPIINQESLRTEEYSNGQIYLSPEWNNG